MGAFTNAAHGYLKGPGLLLSIMPTILCIPIFVLELLVLTGCLSQNPGVPNLYLISLHSADSKTSSDLHVRVGYFGMCGVEPSGKRVCVGTHMKKESDVFDILFPDPKMPERDAAKGLISVAKGLQNDFFANITASVSIAFFFGGIVSFLVLRSIVQSKAAKGQPLSSGTIWFKRLVWALFLSAAALWLSASLTTLKTAGALQFIEGGPIVFKANSTVQTFHWLGFAPEGLFILWVSWALAKASRVANVHEQVWNEETGGAGAMPPPMPPA